jgi:hypothetical protein
LRAFFGGNKEKTQKPKTKSNHPPCRPDPCLIGLVGLRDLREPRGDNALDDTLPDTRRNEPEDVDGRRGGEARAAAGLVALGDATDVLAEHEIDLRGRLFSDGGVVEPRGVAEHGAERAEAPASNLGDTAEVRASSVQRKEEEE